MLHIKKRWKYAKIGSYYYLVISLKLELSNNYT